MSWNKRLAALGAGVLLLVLAAVSIVTPGWRSLAGERQLPTRVSDQEFWRIVSEFSEPDGYFRSDNFLSNEINFQRVIPALTSTAAPGGVYLGVGPEQNFTYLVALKPRIAFIIDIRRQNMLEQLLYKAFIELSADRAEFLSRLFARKRPAALDTSSSVDQLFQSYSAAAPSEALFKANLRAALDRLEKLHRFTLTEDDERRIEYVYRAFYEGGPALDYSSSVGSRGFGFGRGFMPSYTELMTATDDQGEQRSYLASEENFRILKRLETDNAVIPLVGDFAGDKAIRSVGRYLSEHGSTVTAYYTSNVEQYLFQQGDNWKKFLSNVATLPVDGRSTFIRSVSNGWYGTSSPGRRATTLLCPIADLVKAFAEDRIYSYSDVIGLSK